MGMSEGLGTCWGSVFKGPARGRFSLYIRDTRFIEVFGRGRYVMFLIFRWRSQ